MENKNNFNVGIDDGFIKIYNKSDDIVASINSTTGSYSVSYDSFDNLDLESKSNVLNVVKGLSTKLIINYTNKRPLDMKSVMEI